MRAAAAAVTVEQVVSQSDGQTRTSVSTFTGGACRSAVDRRSLINALWSRSYRLSPRVRWLSTWSCCWRASMSRWVCTTVSTGRRNTHLPTTLVLYQVTPEYLYLACTKLQILLPVLVLVLVYKYAGIFVYW